MVFGEDKQEVTAEESKTFSGFRQRRSFLWLVSNRCWAGRRRRREKIQLFIGITCEWELDKNL